MFTVSEVSVPDWLAPKQCRKTAEGHGREKKAAKQGSKESTKRQGQKGTLAGHMLT